MANPFLTSPRPAPSGGEDPLISTFLHRVGPQLAATFSDEQLAGIRLAFSSRAMGRHSIDWRRSVRLFGRSFYVVLLLGKEARTGRRAGDRVPGPIAHAVVILSICLVAAGGLTLLAALAYLAKISLGVDLFPGFDTLNDAAIERLRR